jgi:hypothetical protein
MVPDDQGDDDLTIHFDEMIEEAAPPTAPKGPTAPRGWLVVAAAVAVVLLVGGVLFVTDRNRDDAATEPPVTSPVVSLPVVTAVVSLSSQVPVSWMKVKDPVSGYRWSRVPSDLAVFGSDPDCQEEEACQDKAFMAIQDVIAGGPGLVAVGRTGNIHTGDAAVWTSRDGTTWSRLRDVSSVFDDEAGGMTWMSSVVHADSILVAVGGRNRCCKYDVAAIVWTSPDGIIWSRTPDNETVFDGARMNSVTTGGPGLVAVGNEKREGDEQSKVAVWTSPDGITWSRVPHDNADFDGASMVSVVSGAFGLVAVGADWVDERAAVWTSPDGISWSRVRSDETVFSENTEMKSVTIGGPGLVAVGTDWSDGGSAAVWTSPDGITWSRVPHDEAVFAGPDHDGSQEGGSVAIEMDDVIAGGPGLIAVGSESQGVESGGAAVWTSPDGLTWSRTPDAESIFGRARMRIVAIGGPGLVAVGDSNDGRFTEAVIWVASLE